MRDDEGSKQSRQSIHGHSSEVKDINITPMAHSCSHPVHALEIAYAMGKTLKEGAHGMRFRMGDHALTDEEQRITLRGYQRFSEQAYRIIMAGAFDLVIWKTPVFETAIRGCGAWVGQEMKREYTADRAVIWVFDEEDGKTIVPDIADSGVQASYNDWRKEDETASRLRVVGAYVYPSQRTIVKTELAPNGQLQYEDIPAVGYVWFYRPVGFEDDTISLSWEPGTPIGMDILRGDSVIIAASEFLKLPFVEKRAQELNHQCRKTYKKAKLTPPTIQTVVLRKAGHEPTGKTVSEEATTEHREFSCHFMVKDHWRKPNQRMKEQRMVYVREHVKGDTSKPFKSKSRVVYVAKR